MTDTRQPSKPWYLLLTAACVRRPGMVLAVWAGILLLAGAGVAQLAIDTTISSALIRTGEPWKTYLRSLDLHGGDEFITIALQSPQKFDRQLLAAVATLTAELEKLPNIRRVDSLATVPLIRRSADGGLNLDAALSDGVPETAAALRELRAQIRNDRIARRSLIAEDERTFAINVVLDTDVEADRLSTVAAVRAAADSFSGRISGVPVFREAVSTHTRSDVARFVPLTVVLIGLVLMVLFRTWRAVAVVLTVGLVGNAVCLGAMGWLGVTLSVTTMVLLSILLALACAYSMHILTEARGASGLAEVAQAAIAVARPVLLSGLTTALGFLSMTSVNIALIRDLAVFGAIGVLAVTAATLTVAPAIVSLRPIPRRGDTIEVWIRNSLAPALARVAFQRGGVLIAGWSVVLVVVGAGIVNIRVASDVILWFPPGNEVRDAYEFIRERLSGITPVNVLIESSDGRPVTLPETIAAIDALAEELQALPQVGKTLSVADPLRLVRSEFSAGELVGLPESQAEVEQYLLLLDGVEQLSDVITSDYTGANILIRMDQNSSSEILELGRWVDRWWASNGPAGLSATTTGIMYEFGRAQDEMARGLIRGLAIAILAIGLILFAIFREVWASFVALLPNLVPLGIAFGAMGLAGFPVDQATIVFGSLALGIAVDDTIHLMLGYRDRRLRGKAAAESLDGCLERVLPALIFTTLAIAIGFAVLTTSGYVLIQKMGFMTASVVVLCLIADLLLLPALLMASVGLRRGKAAPA